MNPTKEQSQPSSGLADGALEKLLSSTGVAYMADGGLETTLVFLHDIDLPDFAAFPLVADEVGRRLLTAYYGPYLRIAEKRGLGMVVDTPTWRANPDWGVRLGFDEAALRSINAEAVTFIEQLAQSHSGVSAVVNGVVGPRGDGYVVGETMGVLEASSYHSMQIGALAASGVGMVTAVTMTYVEEAIGIASSAAAIGVPAMVGFTVEVDGRLPSGATLRSAIEAVDEATDASPVGYMVNCAHPSHFEHVLNADVSAGADWLGRIRTIRANASRMSHAELDEAPELDRGDPDELAIDYQRLARALPNLTVVGGCCGTDHDHLDRIAGALG